MSIGFGHEAELRDFRRWLGYQFQAVPGLLYPAWTLIIFAQLTAFLILPYRPNALTRYAIAIPACIGTLYQCVFWWPEIGISVVIKCIVSTIAQRVWHVTVDPPEHASIDLDRADWREKLEYSLDALNDLKFERFKKGYGRVRPDHSSRSEKIYCLWSTTLLVLARYLCPCTPTKLLIIIQVVYLLSSILNYFRGTGYFLYRPLMTKSLTSFWVLHWHSLFSHFFSLIHTKFKSRPLATCLVFLYSGLWHATFLAPIVEWPSMWKNILLMILCFATQGPLILIDQYCFASGSATLARRIFAWFSVVGIFSLTLHFSEFGHEEWTFMKAIV